MNIYFYLILGIILFEYLLSFIVRTLNLKALDPNLPKEFQDTFDNDKYLKSQEYTKTNSQFSYITSTFSLLVSLAFIFGIPQFGINPLYNEIDLLVRSYGYGSIITGLIFDSNGYVKKPIQVMQIEDLGKLTKIKKCT